MGSQVARSFGRIDRRFFPATIFRARRATLAPPTGPRSGCLVHEQALRILVGLASFQRAVEVQMEALEAELEGNRIVFPGTPRRATVRVGAVRGKFIRVQCQQSGHRQPPCPRNFNRAVEVPSEKSLALATPRAFWCP